MLNVDKDDFVPIYEQVMFQIQAGIASGRFRAGDQLPSVREIAFRLQINPNTVAKTLGQLDTLGCIRSQRGKGVFVADGVDGQCRARCEEVVLRLLHTALNFARKADLDWPSLLDRLDGRAAAPEGASDDADRPDAVDTEGLLDPVAPTQGDQV